MNETYIQTIRGGIQRVIHLAKDHWTQEPKRCGFNHHHELYGYIPVCKLSKLIREARNETWEEYAWLCYENRYLTLEQMAAQMLECESYTKFSTTLYETFKQKYQMESHHTVAKVFALTASNTAPSDKAKEEQKWETLRKSLSIRPAT